MRVTDKTQEAERVMSICNACRYCEGHCAVFQAMELRLEFNSDSLDYLSNLCHNCGSCYHNCQYAPPHEFSLNVPAAMAELRQENYGVYAWPSSLGKLYSHNGVWTTLLSVFVITSFIILTSLFTGSDFFGVHPNGFYGVLSHNALVSIFGTVAVFVLVALTLSIRNFWKVMNLPSPWKLDWKETIQGIKDALSLRYMDGGNGQGCSYPTDKPSMSRRWFHQLTFWGFIFCFLATSTGTLMHYVLDLPAPYGYISLPKLFGILGGIGLIVGPIGLLSLKYLTPDNTKGKTNKGMDVSFLILLLMTSISGLALMVLKETPFVGITLSFHLGVVLALFMSMPYGKFIHGFYRLISLIVFSMEKSNKQAIVGTNEIPIKKIS
ncbi:tricarballylate utilization 4Fe-4S protein TcuB [Acinetobacter venetianus]|uniref:tricarballylate utilization 4Fe-4S protein TcuB n=1 Tax=Acinetobacter venetianus TaxID=52133 RepID=UPI003A8F66E0